MDTAARLVKAEECKTEGNAHFKKSEWLPSFVSYLAGIWFMRRGAPPCPQIVATGEGTRAAYAEVPAALGAGAPGTVEEPLPADAEAKRMELRCALHLNLAAAALKLEQWAVARTACQFVLTWQGSRASPKARYRLAKALEKEGELEQACDVLESLLLHNSDGENEDAEKLLKTLKERIASTPKKVDYSKLDATQWAAMSVDEQNRAMAAINSQLDEEMGEDPEWNDAALRAVVDGKL